MLRFTMKILIFFIIIICFWVKFHAATTQDRKLIYSSTGVFSSNITVDLIRYIVEPSITQTNGIYTHVALWALTLLYFIIPSVCLCLDVSDSVNTSPADPASTGSTATDNLADMGG